MGAEGWKAFAPWADAEGVLVFADDFVGVGLVGDDEVLSLEAGAYVVVSEAVFSCCGFTFER